MWECADVQMCGGADDPVTNTIYFEPGSSFLWEASLRRTFVLNNNQELSTALDFLNPRICTSTHLHIGFFLFNPHICTSTHSQINT